MNPNAKEPTFYDVLKINPGATMPEIQAAYQSAKAAFSRDSVATYTLYSPSEIEAAVKEIEDAYSTLSSWDKRRDYDRRLSQGQGQVPTAAPTPVPQAAPKRAPQSSAPLIPVGHSPRSVLNMAPTPHFPTTTAAGVSIPTPFTGKILREIREKQNLTIEEVARITKIPLKVLKAIEGEEQKDLPARVYLQGFIKNVAHLYKLPPQEAARLFLENLNPPV